MPVMSPMTDDDNTIVRIRLGTANIVAILKTEEDLIRMIYAFFISRSQVTLQYSNYVFTGRVQKLGQITQFIVNVFRNESGDELYVQFQYLSGCITTFKMLFRFCVLEIINTGSDVRRYTDNKILSSNMLPEPPSRPNVIGSNTFILDMQGGTSAIISYVHSVLRNLFGSTHFINELVHSGCRSISCFPHNNDTNERFKVCIKERSAIKGLVFEFRLCTGDNDIFNKSYVDRFQTHVVEHGHNLYRVAHNVSESHPSYHSMKSANSSSNSTGHIMHLPNHSMIPTGYCMPSYGATVTDDETINSNSTNQSIELIQSDALARYIVGIHRDATARREAIALSEVITHPYKTAMHVANTCDVSYVHSADTKRSTEYVRSDIVDARKHTRDQESPPDILLVMAHIAGIELARIGNEKKQCVKRKRKRRR